MKNPARINALCFLTLACLWSGSFIGIKVVVDSWPPLFGAAMRVGIALLAITIIIKVLRKKVKVPFALRWKIWCIGLFAQGIPFSFLFWGERIISPGLAGILNGTVSIWTFVLSLIFFPTLTQFSFLKSIGLLIGLFGVAIIFWPILAFDTNLMTLAGTVAILMMAISYAVGNLLNQHFLQGKTRLDFYTNIYHQHCASLVFLIIISSIFEAWPTLGDLKIYAPWLASVYLGVFSTALAFVMYYHLIREWDGIRASTVMYIVPALTLLWDDLFFGNEPGLAELIGVATVLCGVVLIQLSSLKLEWFKTKRIISSTDS